jgi:hypothetical protein
MSPRLFIALLLSLSAGPAVLAKESPACAAQDVRRALAGRLSIEERAALTVPFEADAEIRALALKVTAPAHNERGKLELLLRFFRGQGFAEGYQKDWTRTARDVLESKRGNCLSYASLFVAMARSAGLQACFLDGSAIEPEFGPKGSVLLQVGHILAGVQIGPELIPVDVAQTARNPARFDVLTDLEAVADFYNNQGYEISWRQSARGGLASEEARRAFDLATRIEPGFARAWNNLGVSHARQGDDDRAERAFRNAILADPGLAAAHANLGQLHARRNQDSEAAARLARAVELDDGNAHYHYLLGKALVRLGRTDAAAAEFERAAALDGRLFPAMVQLLKIHQARSDLARARAMALEILKIQPRQRDAVLVLGSHPADPR